MLLLLSLPILNKYNYFTSCSNALSVRLCSSIILLLYDIIIETHSMLLQCYIHIHLCARLFVYIILIYDNAYNMQYAYRVRRKLHHPHQVAVYMHI